MQDNKGTAMRLAKRVTNQLRQKKWTPLSAPSVMRGTHNADRYPQEISFNFHIGTMVIVL